MRKNCRKIQRKKMRKKLQKNCNGKWLKNCSSPSGKRIHQSNVEFSLEKKGLNLPEYEFGRFLFFGVVVPRSSTQACVRGKRWRLRAERKIVGLELIFQAFRTVNFWLISQPKKASPLRPTSKATQWRPLPPKINSANLCVNAGVGGEGGERVFRRTSWHFCCQQVLHTLNFKHGAEIPS